MIPEDSLNEAVYQNTPLNQIQRTQVVEAIRHKYPGHTSGLRDLVDKCLLLMTDEQLLALKKMLPRRD